MHRTFYSTMLLCVSIRLFHCSDTLNVMYVHVIYSLILLVAGATAATQDCSDAGFYMKRICKW